MPRKLMVKTREGRWFLAPPDSLDTLLSWARHFRGTIYQVRTSRPSLDIHQIMNALDHPENLATQPPETPRDIIYEPRTTRRPTRTVIQAGNYSQFLEQAQKVREWTTAALHEGRTICLDDLVGWARDHHIQLSKGGLSRHLQKVLETATASGYTVVKNGRTYSITRNHRTSRTPS